MVTRGDAISRIRNLLKASKEDAFLTDRMIYSVILKHAKYFIRRQDNEGKIMQYQTLFERVPCVDLIDVDKVEACCGDIKSKCIIKRTKDKLPLPFDGAFGPLFRSVTSIDGSNGMVETHPSTYTAIANSTRNKYNKTKYYWYLDGHLYFPNIHWDAVSIEAMWEDNVQYLKCVTEEESCIGIQEKPTNVPDYLFTEIEQQVLAEFGMSIQIPSDSKDNDENMTTR